MGQFDRAGLANRLTQLAAEQIYIGTSSWKYEGWLGQVYSQERYITRGKFSRAKFEANCLTEYGETFPAVCGDFAFDQFPKPEFWTKLFSAAPPNLNFGLKVCEEITCRRFPTHPRYGARGGLDNPSFLNADLFQALLEPLAPYRDRVGPLIFEFGTFSKELYPDPQKFLNHLNVFLGRLPATWRYSEDPQPKLLTAGIPTSTASAQHSARLQRLGRGCPRSNRRSRYPTYSRLISPWFVRCYARGEHTKQR